MAKKSITFAEALKRGRPAAFSTMVKPAGSLCNMDCAYCYYIGKAELYDNRQPVMSEELLEEYIKQYIEANDVPAVTFLWHGGEPLTAGIGYFRKAMEFQHKYAGGKEIDNTLQTNGLLINEEWARFFRENNFLTGISIDGPKDIHDACRMDKGGKPTFDRVMKGLELLAKHGVEYNTLSVVNATSEGRGKDVYRFLKAAGSRYMQFLPAVEYVVTSEEGREAIVAPGTAGSHRAQWSVSAKGYGEFLNDIFDDWVISDVGAYFVQMFDVALAQWYGAPPGLCSFSDSCGDALVVEHNGDVYSCDHFVYPGYRLGNIKNTHLKTLFESKEQFNFGLDKRNTLPDECLKCRWYFACKGECPKHRFDTPEGGGAKMNALCEGFRIFFRHADPYMKYMCSLLDTGRAPAMVIPWARQRMGIF